MRILIDRAISETQENIRFTTSLSVLLPSHARFTLFVSRAPLLALPERPQGLSYYGCNEKRERTKENRS